MLKPHTDRLLPGIFKKLAQCGWNLGPNPVEESPVVTLERLAHACCSGGPKNNATMLPLPDWFLAAFEDAQRPKANQTQRKLIASYLDFSETLLDIVDSMVLWLDHVACCQVGPKEYFGLFKSRQNELRDNSFYKFLAQEPYAYKMDNIMLGRGTVSEKLSLHRRLQFLGAFSCENLATKSIRTHLHQFLLSKYKTETIPNIFLDFFDSVQDNPFFAQVVIVSGYFILYFSIEDYLAGLHESTIDPGMQASLEESSVEQMVEYFRALFVNGIALNSPETHFRYDKIEAGSFQRKIGQHFWQHKLRGELLRREKDPFSARSTTPEVCDIQDDAAELDYHSCQVFGRILPGTIGSFDLIRPKNFENSCLSCTLLGVKDARLILGAREDDLKQCRAEVGDAGVFRFSLKTQAQDSKYYACQCAIQHVRVMIDKEAILVVVPNNAVMVLDRRHPRIVPGLLPLQEINGWFGLAGPPQNLAELQSLGPAGYAYPRSSEVVVENISAGGVCLVINSRELWRQVREASAKLTLLQVRLREDVAGARDFLLTCRIRSLRQDDHSCFAGLHFLAEADGSTAGRCHWRDIAKSGCAELSRVIFAALLRSRKGG